MENSAIYLILFAVLSALSRGVITVIDRYQMGYRKSSVMVVNFYNNLLSMLLVTGLLGIVVARYGFGLSFTPLLMFRLLIYAGLVQAVAYGYSAIFKKVTVMESVLLSKLTDFIIPLGIFATTWYFNWHSYIISIVSTLLVIWLFYSTTQKSTNNSQTLFKYFWLIGPVLVIQAAISPWLVTDIKTTHALIIFTILTIYLRFLITSIALLRSKKYLPGGKNKISKHILMLYSIRAILTIVAQLSFTLATSSKNSSIAWVFLNMTSLFSVVILGVVLQEKVRLREFLVLIIIVCLGILTSFI